MSPAVSSSTTTTRTTRSGGPSAPQANLVQRGHTVTTVRETQRTTTTNKRGNQVVKTKTKTIFYVDGKPVHLNWFQRQWIKVMSTHEKQAYLAQKFIEQERKAAR